MFETISDSMVFYSKSEVQKKTKFINLNKNRMKKKEFINTGGALLVYY